MKTCLETEGFDVITAANGLEGLQRYKENENKVRVVVTDLQMPAMNGSDMIQQIFELTPAMKVIVASGQSFKYAQAAAACGATSCLQKPYSPSELRDALRSLL